MQPIRHRVEFLPHLQHLIAANFDRWKWSIWARQVYGLIDRDIIEVAILLRILDGRRVIDSVDAGPPCSRVAHRTRLATCVERAAGKMVRFPFLARGSNRNDFTMASWIVLRKHLIHTFRDDFSILNDDATERTAYFLHDGIVMGQFNGSSNEVDVLGHLGLSQGKELVCGAYGSQYRRHATV